MQTAQIRVARQPTAEDLAPLAALKPHWVLAFGSVDHIAAPGLAAALSAACPQAVLSGCSTAGEISRNGVNDDHLVLSAVRFDSGAPVVVTTELQGMEDSRAAGARLAREMVAARVHTVLVLGQGVAINGSALVDGMREVLPPQVVLSGGLAGDGGAFKRTFTLSNRGSSDRQIVAVGFAAPSVRFRHGCFHGWRPFGPARRVTRSQGNVLFELDSQPALEVYKRYLGEYARDLPGSGLLFPFQMLGSSQDSRGLIRTILGVNEADGSLVLAGDIDPQGYLRLMHASTDSLVEGAQSAAENATFPDGVAGDSLAILVSCVGRKLVMGARVDEEVEAVADVFGQRALVTGFYSNGEISPGLDGLECSLHNQTMTITHLCEVAA